MADHTGEEMKGRAKEAAGTMTGDKKLKREGKVDQASASVKDKVSDAADVVKDAVNSDRRHR
ncbi:MAG TPA: CsbD family protein [Euzebyales bacterium]|nr:CsbD family protein [Euzebyales bacterium]